MSEDPIAILREAVPLLAMLATEEARSIQSDKRRGLKPREPVKRRLHERALKAIAEAEQSTRKEAST